MPTAVELKNKGNEALKSNEFQNAIEFYTKAIEIDPTVAVFYSNRAQVYIKTEAFGLAIEDANKSIELDENYLKGYYRRAVANGAIMNYKESIKDLKIVLKKNPNDKVARGYYNEFNKILKRRRFEEAIQGEDIQSIFTQINFNSITVSKESNPFTKELEINIVNGNEKLNKWQYQEIDLPTIDQTFIDEMIAIFKKGLKLPKKYAYAIIFKANQIFRKEQSLVEISLPDISKNKNKIDKLNILEGCEKITICGDTHGQFFDLLNIFEKYGKVSKSHAYLFNGDFVDRGSWSTEIAFLLYALKIVYPNRLFINRGNHETDSMNEVYGFMGECVAKYNETLFKLFSESFGSLPLATLIGNDYLIMHGGLFSNDDVTLDDIRKINRLKSSQPSRTGIEMELLWTDPQSMPGRSANRRGIGIQFGPDVTRAFCEKSNLSGIIRSHEVRMNGYEKEHDGKLITVFSAPNYCDSQGNKGACIDITNDGYGSFDLKFNVFEAVPHPDIKPMAYAGLSGLS